MNMFTFKREKAAVAYTTDPLPLLLFEASAQERELAAPNKPRCVLYLGSSERTYPPQ